jgi:hypothetical protein
MNEPDEHSIEHFIARWQHADGGERANYQLFLTELCALLGLDRPDPASVDTEENASFTGMAPGRSRRSR